MSNRPIKKEHQRYERIAGKCYTIGWNACIDAYEQWEKENLRLERLDYEKVKTFYMLMQTVFIRWIMPQMFQKYLSSLRSAKGCGECGGD